ncbi:MAG: glycosyltransferase family 2 protein [Gammaproteobacteria bacterium]
MNLLPISVLILSLNEENNIADAIKSSDFAKEIIVVDAESSDQTAHIALNMGAQVIINPWKNETTQRRFALEKASENWILFLDADERISPELAQELMHLDWHNPRLNPGFEIPFQSYYLNHPIRWGDWRGESHVRLFRKATVLISDRAVHCEIKCQNQDAPLGRLKGKILHFSFPTLETVLEKINRYSSLGAEAKIDLGKKGGFWKAVIRGLWTFIRGYIFKLGFLDGKYGFMLAVSNAEGCYYKYLKMG